MLDKIKNMFKKSSVKNPVDDNKLLFNTSRPWGYYPKEVDEAIEKLYKEIRHLSKRNEELQNQVREMHIQMSNVELPEADEAISDFVLNNFKNTNFINKDDGKEAKSPGHIKINKNDDNKE